MVNSTCIFKPAKITTLKLFKSWSQLSQLHLQSITNRSNHRKLRQKFQHRIPPLNLLNNHQVVRIWHPLRSITNIRQAQIRRRRSIRNRKAKKRLAIHLRTLSAKQIFKFQNSFAHSWTPLRSGSTWIIGDFVFWRKIFFTILCFNLLRFTFCGSKFGTIKSKLNWVFYLTFFLHLLKIIYY